MGSLTVSAECARRVFGERPLSPADRVMAPYSPAFFLTAHFSQEDYPYDWYVAALSRTHLETGTDKLRHTQADALAFQGESTRFPRTCTAEAETHGRL